MKTFLKLAGLFTTTLITVGCQFYARAPEDYSKETGALLASKNDEIKSCYDEVLKTDSKAEGIVAVTFKVEKKTGKIVDPAIDKERTTVSDTLSACVINAINGLTLDPPDQRDGLASFEYEFKANAPKQL